MPPTEQHREAEAAFRNLIDDGDLAEPDDVQYMHEGVLFLWHAPQLAVMVEFDDVADPQPQNTPSGSSSISASSGATSFEAAASYGSQRPVCRCQ
jgi:hypothetical protein